MDATDYYITKFAAVTLEACATCFLYAQYRTHAECLRSLKEAKCLELDSELKKNVEKNNGEIKYAVISGTIKALTSPLYSQYIPFFSGVIREEITFERKSIWIHCLQIGFSASNLLQRTVSYVPFALCDKPTNLFKKKIAVEVIEPLRARELVIPTVHDEIYYCPRIAKNIFDIFEERTLAIRVVERLLCNNKTLTAVGKLVIENNMLKMKPPAGNLTYFLTPLSLESLIKKVKYSTEVLKVTSIIVGALNFALFIYISRLAFLEIKRRVVLYWDRRKWNKERKLRRMVDKLRRMMDKVHKIKGANLPKCVACMDNPLETIILECGHICLCYECSEHIRNLCPICRNPIARTVSAFWS